MSIFAFCILPFPVLRYCQLMPAHLQNLTYFVIIIKIRLGLWATNGGNMTFQQLSFIVEVANCVSISKAAEKLYTHQSNISTAIKQLEEEFGVQLFVRTKKGVSLTKEGEEFLVYAKEILHQKSFLENLYTTRNMNLENRLSISSMRAFFLLESTRRILKNLPKEMMDGSYIRLSKHSFMRILDDVANNLTDIGIVFIQAPKKNQIKKLTSLKGLNYFELGSSQLHVVVRNNHPVLENPSLENLSNYPYIISEEEEQYDRFFDEPFDALTEFFKKRPFQTISTNDSFVCESIVSESDAFHISTMPHQRAKRQRCTSIELPGEDAQLIFYYVTRKHYAPSPLAEHFITELKKIFMDTAFTSPDCLLETRSR